MTTATDTDPETKHTEFLTAFHDLYVFFAEHPEEIDGMVVRVEGYRGGSKDTQREQVIRFSDLVGPCTVDTKDEYTFAQVKSTAFAPHHLSVSVLKESVGHKVRDAVPEEWDWDALS
jgi:hypothetical protein